MSRIIFVLVLLLIILHQDNWFWTDSQLVFGFMPIGLFYHACLSVSAALVWWLAVCIAWPKLDGPNLSKGATGPEQESPLPSAATQSGRHA
ncbi:MAG: DUF3311 domain-containing protein [Pirellulales bacterium]